MTPPATQVSPAALSTIITISHRAAAVVCDADAESVGRVQDACLASRQRCHCCRVGRIKTRGSSVRLTCCCSTDSCRHLHHQPHNCRPQLCRQSSSPPPWLPRPSALPTSGRSVLSCSRRVSVLRGEACTSSRDCCSPPPPPPPAGAMAHRAAAVVCDTGVESVGHVKDACLAS